MTQEFKIKIRPRRLMKYIFLFTFILSMGSIYYASMFLYHSFYNTIEESNKLLVLKKEVSSNSLDMSKFNSIIKKLEEKSSSNSKQTKNNPFNITQN